MAHRRDRKKLWAEETFWSKTCVLGKLWQWGGGKDQKGLRFLVLSLLLSLQWQYIRVRKHGGKLYCCFLSMHMNDRLKPEESKFLCWQGSVPFLRQYIKAFIYWPLEVLAQGDPENSPSLFLARVKCYVHWKIVMFSSTSLHDCCVIKHIYIVLHSMCIQYCQFCCLQTQS